MNERKNISEELSAISPAVAAIPVVNVFSVPGNYFDTLTHHILSSVYLDNTNPLYEIEKKSSTVPEGYFEGLADAIMHKIKAEASENSAAEILHLSPAVSAIGNKNIFTVPANYFETNVQRILNHIPKPAKVVEMKTRSSFFNYAAAAVVTGIIGLSVLSIFNNKTNTNNSLLPATVMAHAGEIIKTNSFDKELNSVSDKDIQQYLEQQGQDVNAALVASSTDNNNLPSPEDYIIDDKTLDDYLNKINLNN